MMVSVQGIKKSFDGHPVLKDVSFEVAKGSTFAILGQSGSGKSVLLKTIAGILYPDKGKIKLKTKNIGMLFQKNALFDSMTVIENLDFTLRERMKLSKSERHELCLKFLSAVGLSGTEKQFPDELSGGMQKRLGIARALIVKPELILYDEPTAGLDPITSRIIADLILSLKKEYKSTVIVVTSDVMRAYQYCEEENDQISLLIPDKSHASTLLLAGNAKAAKKSTDPSLKQFLHGYTTGPLTTGAATHGH